MNDSPDRPTDIQIAALKRLARDMGPEQLADLLMKAVPAPVLECAVEELSAVFDYRMRMLKEGRTPPSFGLRLAD